MIVPAPQWGSDSRVPTWADSSPRLLMSWLAGGQIWRIRRILYDSSHFNSVKPDTYVRMPGASVHFHRMCAVQLSVLCAMRWSPAQRQSHIRLISITLKISHDSSGFCPRSELCAVGRAYSGRSP